VLLAVNIGLAGCGDTEGPEGGTLRIAGTYATAVALRENSCGAVTVQPNPTTVEHAPPATAFTLRHAGQSYTGTLAQDGSFSTAPRTLAVGAETLTLRITGRFAGNGFEADVRVDVARGGAAAPCFYVVHWTGTRQGQASAAPASWSIRGRVG
jgi:hypothetical protein